MDYYASWPSWRMPKWLGAILGGVFTLILVVSIGLIIHLTRPVRPATASVVVAAKTAPVVGPTATTPVVPGVKATAPVVPEVKATAPVVAHTAVVAIKKRRGAARGKRHAILAKQEPRTKRQPKNDIDRLLGL